MCLCVLLILLSLCVSIPSVHLRIKCCRGRRSVAQFLDTPLNSFNFLSCSSNSKGNVCLNPTGECKNERQTRDSRVLIKLRPACF